MAEHEVSMMDCDNRVLHLTLLARSSKLPHMIELEIPIEPDHHLHLDHVGAASAASTASTLTSTCPSNSS